MSPELIGVLGFVALVALLALRVPVGIAMIAVSVVCYSIVVSPDAALARLGSDEGFGAACVAVGGTLGILIPPSAPLVLYGILTEEPIGALLIGGIVPGIMTTILLMITAYILVRLRPQLSPQVGRRHDDSSLLALLARIWSVPAIFGLSMGASTWACSRPPRPARSAPSSPSATASLPDV